MSQSGGAAFVCLDLGRSAENIGSGFNSFPADALARPVAKKADKTLLYALVQSADGEVQSVLCLDSRAVWQWIVDAVRPAFLLKRRQNRLLIVRRYAELLDYPTCDRKHASCGVPRRSCGSFRGEAHISAGERFVESNYGRPFEFSQHRAGFVDYVACQIDRLRQPISRGLNSCEQLLQVGFRGFFIIANHG